MRTTSQWCCQMVRIYNASQSELLQHQSPKTQLNRRINQQLSIWPVVHWYNGRVYNFTRWVVNSWHSFYIYDAGVDQVMCMESKLWPIKQDKMMARLSALGNYQNTTYPQIHVLVNLCIWERCWCSCVYNGGLSCHRTKEIYSFTDAEKVYVM